MPIRPRDISRTTFACGKWTPTIRSFRRATMSRWWSLTAMDRPFESPISAQAQDSVEDLRNSGYANGKPSVLVIIYRQPGANIIDTVDNIRAVLPLIQSSIPQSIDVRVAMDQTVTIRASVGDTERTLVISVIVGDPGGFRFPEKRADDLHSQRRRPRVAGGNLRRDVSAGLQPRQSFADGADHLDRLRGRRRHRGNREHHALSGSRACIL